MAGPISIRIPDRPSLDGLEDAWARRWDEDGIYCFDRSAARGRVYSIDTPPPTVSGVLHVGSAFSYTHTDIIARFKRMRGMAVFYPMGWDDNGLPTERRVQNHFGVRCDPSLPYERDQPLPGKSGRAGAGPAAVSRRKFIELCGLLTAADEKAFEEVWRRLGLSVDWSLTYATIDDTSRAAAQRAFLRNLARGEAYLAEAPGLWDVTFGTAVAQAELEDRDWPGAWHRLVFRGPGGDPVHVETTRPELLPACVALVAHPSDSRYTQSFGKNARSPLFGVEVPILAHPAADPGRGTGIAMCCTFGDLTDVQWWRELRLPTRPVVGRDGRMLASPPPGLEHDAARQVYAELAGLTVARARDRVAAMLRASGAADGEPRPVVRPVKFYEKGELPLEIVTSRQWYLRNGGRETAQPGGLGGRPPGPAQPGGLGGRPPGSTLRDALLARGRELRWFPEYMRVRYENWVNGLNGDWLLSRQRFFGVPIPVWYRLDADGEPSYGRPIPAAEASLPVDPSSQPPPGFGEEQRGKPGGFTGEADVLDTWATSSLTPLIAGGWERDPGLLRRVYPMDLRPQGHDIIRTWLFSTVLRSHLEFGGPPWRDVAISGFILDPGRKKMSKSKGNAVTPMDLLREYGSDGFRYWAASARLGTDAAFDTGQMKIGRRLAIKILNASKFVLGVLDRARPAPAGPGTVRDGSSPADGPGAVTRPLDRSMLAALALVIERATEALERYDHTGALEVTERFFWGFCDDYLELVKARAYSGDQSAGAALALALSALLRLFAPVMPFVTEEAWSWWRDGHVHVAAWPSAGEIGTGGAGGTGGDPALLDATSVALRAIRKAKSEAKLSMRADVSLVTVSGPRAALVEAAADDLAAAGRAARIVFAADSPGDPDRDPPGNQADGTENGLRVSAEF
jgi:valyl-tRNA synthetase